MPPVTSAAERRSRFGWLLCLVALVAFALREQFVLFSFVEVPIRGDILEYVSYAWNLQHHGILSEALPGKPIPTPDSYRLPGYAYLIALAMWCAPQGFDWRELAGWYPLVLQMQVVLGTATAVLASLLARHWVKPAWACVAGLLVALWPHHVVATGAMLSEVVFGFFLTLGAFAYARAWTTDKPAWFIASGAAFGYGYLVNPIVLLFPFCLALMTAWMGRREGAAWMLAVFLLPVVLFAMRSASLPESGHSSVHRARMNFVQGSWPHYHTAANYQHVDPRAKAIVDRIDGEIRLLRENRAAGMDAVSERLSADPARAARWYLLDKPWLLWAWDIQIGWGGVYVLGVERSPLDRPPLDSLVAAFKAINPMLSALMLAACVVLTFGGWRRAGNAVPLAAMGALGLYLTLVHMVLQAEPRYAIPYRPLEAVIVVVAIAWFVARLRAHPKLFRRKPAG